MLFLILPAFHMHQLLTNEKKKGKYFMMLIKCVGHVMTTNWFKLNVSCPAIGIQTSKFVKIPKYPVLDKANDFLKH